MSGYGGGGDAGLGGMLPGGAPLGAAGPSLLAGLPAPLPMTEAQRAIADLIEQDNIADSMDDAERSQIAARVGREFKLDDSSRADWLNQYEQWLDMAMQIAEEKTYPWPQASNFIYPLITTAAVQFHARAYPSIIRDRNVVKGTVWGDDKGIPMAGPDGQPMIGPDGQPQWLLPPGAKREQADRIGEHMSWQLLDDMPGWEGDVDRLLLMVPITGCMFRKVFWDAGERRNASELLTAKEVVCNYRAKSFASLTRITQVLTLYPHEVEEKIRSGVYLDQDYGHDQDGQEQADEDAPITFLEQHRRLDLDGDGYAEPYIVTISRDSQKLARIVAAYDMEGVTFSRDRERVVRIKPTQFFVKFGFLPSPDGGVYDVGFGHLLAPINDGVNSTINQMFDAGHLANAGGGFVSQSLSMNAGSVRFQVGEYKQVMVSSGAIRDAIMPLPFAGPNPVLFELLKFLVEAGKEIAAIKDILVGDLPGDNTSGVATLAMIEQGLQVFTAIFKRLHRSFAEEFKLLFRLNRLYLPEQSGYQGGEEWREISQRDYAAGGGVEPVSDPRMLTDMQKLGRAQFLMSFKDDPWFNPREVRMRMLDATLIPNVSGLLVDQPPKDPAAGLAVAELQMEKAALDLREKELDIRAANEEGMRDIKRGQEKAAGILKLAQSINQLAQAAKADAEVNQGWYQAHLDALRMEMDRIATSAEEEPPEASPALAAATSGQQQGGGGMPGAPAGAAAPPPAMPGGDMGVQPPGEGMA